ncbi:MAG: SHOCT domain-containing protein [Acidimicrobiia bacterium]
MFSAESRAARKAERARKLEESRAAFAAKHPERAAAWEAAKAAHQHRRDEKTELKGYVKSNRAIASYNGVHVYSDRIIRLPDMVGGMIGVEPECRPIAGVTASTARDGSVGARSTLTRSMVPGMHGWQKKTDDRQGFIVIDGPDFQWQIKYSPQMDLGGARKFAAAVTTAGRRAAALNPQPAGTAPAGLAERLGELTRLRDSGALSEDEFTVAKTRLLAQP